LMCPFNNQNSGFSLFEIIVSMMIISTLVVLTAPNLLGIYQKFQFKDSFSQLQSSIKTSQRQAKKLGKTCKIKLSKIDIKGKEVNRIAIVSSTDPGEKGKDYKGCLLREINLPYFVDLETNIPGITNKITFSYKGNTPTSGTIKLSLPKMNLAKCLVVSNGLGIIRTGNYEDNSSKVTSTKCKKEQLK